MRRRMVGRRSTSRRGSRQGKVLTSLSPWGNLSVRHQGRDGFVLKGRIQIGLDAGIEFMDRAGPHAVAGAISVRVQAAIDAGGALHQVDDLVEGDVLRPAAEGEAAARAPLGGEQARPLQRRGQRGDHRLGNAHLTADLAAGGGVALEGEIVHDPYGVIGGNVQLHGQAPSVNDRWRA